MRPIVITGPTYIARKAAASSQIDRYRDIGRNDHEDRHDQPFEVTRRHSDSRTEQRTEDQSQGFLEVKVGSEVEDGALEEKNWSGYRSHPSSCLDSIA